MRYRHRTGLAAASAVVFLGAAGIATSVIAHAAVAGCQVAYTVSSQWPGGFGANVAITNLGDPITGWSLRWTFPAGQTVTQAWNANVPTGTSTPTATNVGWNASIGTNATVSFGFNGAYSGTNPAPTNWTLNGVACNGPVTTTGPTTPTTRATSGPTTRATTPPTTRVTTPPTTRATTGPTSGPTTPPIRTVRVYWLRPSDVAFDQRYPDGIAAVMREAQRYYKQEMGVTFTLNNPVVEVIVGEHVRSWYENTPACGEKYWWTVCNMQAEIIRRLGVQAPDNRWLNVGEISAEGEGAGGGGGNGWVILSGHDADGAAGINGAMNRWYGGMVHEIGHALGLPDSTSTDGTPMSASFYNYPNTHFSQAQKDAIRNGRYGSFLS